MSTNTKWALHTLVWGGLLIASPLAFFVAFMTFSATLICYRLAYGPKGS